MVIFNDNNDIKAFKKAKKIAKNLKKDYYIKYYIKYFLNEKCDVNTAKLNILYTKLPIIKKVYENKNEFKFDIDSISNNTKLEKDKCIQIIKQWSFKNYK